MKKATNLIFVSEKNSDQKFLTLGDHFGYSMEVLAHFFIENSDLFYCP